MECASESRDKRLEQYGVNERPVQQRQRTDVLLNGYKSFRSAQTAEHAAQFPATAAKRKRGKASVPRSSLKRHREPLASTRDGHPPPQMEPGANPAADSAAQALPSPEKVDATVPPWRRSIVKHAKMTSSAFRGKSIRAMPRIPIELGSTINSRGVEGSESSKSCVSYSSSEHA